MTRPIIALISTLQLFRILAAAQANPSNTISLSDRTFIASKIYSSIQIYFAHGDDVPDLDLDKAYRAYLSEFLEIDDRRKFDLSTLELLSKLKNGHSWFRDPWLDSNFGQTLPFRADWIEQKWIVLDSSMSQLKRGDIIATIDDSSMEEFFQRNRKYITGSSERALRSSLCWSPYLFPEQFTLTLQSGREIKIDRTSRLLPSSPKSKTEGRWIEPQDIAYLRIPSFNDPEFETDALGFVNQFREAKSLIIDVQANSGGSTPGELIGALMDRPYRQWSESTAVSFSLFRNYAEVLKESTDLPEAERAFLEGTAPMGHPQLIWRNNAISPKNTVFRGHLYILTGRLCGSACEDFVVPFKDNHRAVIVGENTWGSSGMPYIHTFENGMVLAVGTKVEYLPDGSRFEGIGIAPDREVLQNMRNIQIGVNAAFDMAVELAKADR